MSAGKMMLSAMIWLGTGAVLGVLFAPDKGSNTRKKLSKTGSQYLGSLGKGFESMKETATDISGRVKDAVGSLSGSGASNHTRVVKPQNSLRKAKQLH